MLQNRLYEEGEINRREYVKSIFFKFVSTIINIYKIYLSYTIRIIKFILKKSNRGVIEK